MDSRIDPYFCKAFNYGPRDPRYLDCDDIDMVMALYERQVLNDDEAAAQEASEGVARVETDADAWKAMEDEVASEQFTDAEVIARYEQRVQDESRNAEEFEQIEQMLHDLLGDDYQPQTLEDLLAAEEADDERQ